MGALQLPPTHTPTLPRQAGEGVKAQRGYTLIEVIVAFALLAGALTLLLGTLSGAARQVRGSADAGRAALHAQSLLSQLGVGTPLKPGSDSGEFEKGRYRWAVEIQRWNDPTQPTNAPLDLSAPRLLEVRIGVEWGDGGPRERLLLRTLRLVPADAEAGVSP
ncbi:MAG TPA: prepilin-type N-terminal cleavage/methylation domain-containing protein [Lysobacter sp.]|jgi:general secretion pathway protein I|nr:prepilin-type N-terminal cleavage/methylation domain-containing protein [Lysobacter sp.]